MTIAVLFPGQGTDLAAVAGAWYRDSALARRLVDRAVDQLRIPAPRLLHGSGLALRDTRAYQPVLVAVSVAILREIESRIGHAAFAAGHSLGELPACVAAGALMDEDAVSIAAIRGGLMAREAARYPGGMLALRTSVDSAHEALAIAALVGPVSLAANNAPDEQVLSGSHDALRAVPPRFAPSLLATGGAWHSIAMAGALDEFRDALHAVCTAPSRATWLTNRTGDVAERGADPALLLAEQLTHAVQWERTLHALRALGVRTLLTLGPSKALRGLAHRTLGDTLTIISVELPQDLSRAEEALAA